MTQARILRLYELTSAGGTLNTGTVLWDGDLEVSRDGAVSCRKWRLGLPRGQLKLISLNKAISNMFNISAGRSKRVETLCFEHSSRTLTALKGRQKGRS